MRLKRFFLNTLLALVVVGLWAAESRACMLGPDCAAGLTFGTIYGNNSTTNCCCDSSWDTANVPGNPGTGYSSAAACKCWNGYLAACPAAGATGLYTFVSSCCQMGTPLAYRWTSPGYACGSPTALPLATPVCLTPASAFPTCNSATGGTTVDTFCACPVQGSSLWYALTLRQQAECRGLPPTLFAPVPVFPSSSPSVAPTSSGSPMPCQPGMAQ